jgi:hypothetical protein
MIPGSNNGQSGYGMARGAMFPSCMYGPFGYREFPLPNMISQPTGVMDKRYSFGDSVYELTPGGRTTESAWGFETKAFGRKSQRRKSQRRKSQRRKSQRRKSQRRKNLKNKKA